jgi:hypothetical protein
MNHVGCCAADPAWGWPISVGGDYAIESRCGPGYKAKQARIMLLAAAGLDNAEIARRTGTSRPTVVGWRGRYRERP